MTLKLVIPSPRKDPVLYLSTAVTGIALAMWREAIQHPEVCQRWLGAQGPDVFGTFGMLATMFCGADALMHFVRAQRS